MIKVQGRKVAVHTVSMMAPHRGAEAPSVLEDVEVPIKFEVSDGRFYAELGDVVFSDTQFQRVREMLDEHAVKMDGLTFRLYLSPPNGAWGFHWRLYEVFNESVSYVEKHGSYGDPDRIGETRIYREIKMDEALVPLLGTAPGVFTRLRPKMVLIPYEPAITAAILRVRQELAYIENMRQRWDEMHKRLLTQLVFVSHSAESMNAVMDDWDTEGGAEEALEDARGGLDE